MAIIFHDDYVLIEHDYDFEELVFVGHAYQTALMSLEKVGIVDETKVRQDKWRRKYKNNQPKWKRG